MGSASGRVSGVSQLMSGPQTHRTYDFTVTVETPLRWGLRRDRSSPDDLRIPAKSLMGMLREAHTRWLNGPVAKVVRSQEWQDSGAALPRICFDADSLFGTPNQLGAIRVSGLSLDHGEPRTLVGTRPGPWTGEGNTTLAFHEALQPRSLLKGRLSFEPHTPGVIRSVILTALGNLEGPSLPLGRDTTRVRGLLRMQLLESPPPDVFIIYKWGSEQRDALVFDLASRISEFCYVLFDKFGGIVSDKPDVAQSETWMAAQLVSAERVVCILTPDFKDRAAGFNGGVGYEFRLLSAQSAVLSPSIERVVCVLLEGDSEVSTPSTLRACPILDFRHGNLTANVRALVSLLYRREMRSDE